MIAGVDPAPSATLETLTSGIGIADVPSLFPAGGNVSFYADEGAVSISLDPTGVTIMAPTVEIVATSFTINGAQFTVT